MFKLSTRRSLIKLFFLTLFIYIIITIYSFLFYFNIDDNELEKSWRLELGEENEKKMIEPIDIITIPSLYSVEYNYFSLLYLPKRLKYIRFYEQTTANPDTEHLLSPDFTFHLYYHKHHVTLFKDYGSGCIYRLYLLPSFGGKESKLENLLSEKIKDVIINIKIDDVSKNFTLNQINQNYKYPFMLPFSHLNLKAKSGFASYWPFCYSYKAEINLYSSQIFPPNLLNQTVDCVSNELKCPIKQYSSISFLKLPLLKKIEGLKVNLNNKYLFKTISNLLKNPVENSFSKLIGCKLLCKLFKNNNKKIKIFSQNKSGVVTMVMISLATVDMKDDLKNWDNLFLEIIVDNEENPQINVTLDDLFITHSNTNPYKGVAMGRMHNNCQYYHDNGYLGRRKFMVGYFNLPIPYWRNIDIFISNNGFINGKKNFFLCYQVVSTGNLYPPLKTGFLYSSQRFYDSSSISKNKKIVDIKNGWGHFVSLTSTIFNLQPDLQSPLIARWAPLQADPVVFIDGNPEPEVKGTGFEDYFSYAHGFSGAENSSYAFVGVPFSLLYKQKKSNSWGCYRHHILDPISFDSSLLFLTEGTLLGDKMAEEIDYQTYKRLKKQEENVFGYLSFYYFKKNPNSFFPYCQKIKMCDGIKKGIFEINGNVGLNKIYLKSNYIGDNNLTDFKQTNEVCAVELLEKKVFNLTFKFPSYLFENVDHKFKLLHSFHSFPFTWNREAYFYLNNNPLPNYFSPFGSTNKKFTLKSHSLYLLPSHIKNLTDGGYNFYKFSFIPFQTWYDIFYSFCIIPL